jgi:hypothetical protein
MVQIVRLFIWTAEICVCYNLIHYICQGASFADGCSSPSVHSKLFILRDGAEENLLWMLGASYMLVVAHQARLMWLC